MFSLNRCFQEKVHTGTSPVTEKGHTGLLPFTERKRKAATVVYAQEAGAFTVARFLEAKEEAPKRHAIDEVLTKGRSDMNRSTRFILWVFCFAVFSALGACGPKNGGGRGHPPPPAPAPAPSLALYAGNMGGVGTADGTGAAARFWGPSSVATDSAGNVYVADTNNNIIRKITPAGVVTTLAGTAGVTGSTDATGAAASFNLPFGVATDGQGNVYVADTLNNIIRKITPAGVVTTLAGTAGFFGNDDRIGPAATFNGPVGVATDSQGAVYVADLNNNTIRKITSLGEVTTLAGTAGIPGSTDSATGTPRFNSPFGVATDSAGNVYVADSLNNTIRKIVISTGNVSTLAGTAGVRGSDDLTGPAARFNDPRGVATDSAGNVYVAEVGNNTIRKITPLGAVTTLAGTAGPGGSTDATGAAASFSSPFGVATNSAGNVYVADQGNSTIRSITPAGVVTTFAGAVSVIGSADATGAAATFNGPAGVATDSAGNVYVAEVGNNTIRKITSAGVVTTFARSFNGPADVATDSAGYVYVADTLNGSIRKITPAGVVTTLAVTGGSPRGVATDSAGNVYVADFQNNTILKITPLGVVTTLAGMAGVPGGDDNIGAAARFNAPVGVATDSTGNLYVADSFNNTIRKIVISTGAVSTLAGTAGFTGSTNATGAAARFNNPLSVAIDSAGNVYVADNGNSTIRKITPAGVVSTLVGVVGQVGFTPGALPGVLGGPSRVAFRGTSLYITLFNGVAVVKNLP
jgi:streptogramin lyase